MQQSLGFVYGKRGTSAPHWVHCALTTALILVVLYLDLARPFGLSLSIFYIVPLLYAAWNLRGWVKHLSFAVVVATLFLVPILARPQTLNVVRLLNRCYGVAVSVLILYLISERRRFIAALERANEELEERVVARTEELRKTNLNLNQEVSERKQAEESLRASESFLRMSQRVGKVGCWQWDLRTNQVRSSEVLHEIYGIPPEQFDGTLEAAVRPTHPDDAQVVQAALQHVVGGGDPRPMEYRIIKPDGEIRHVWGHGEVTRDQEGKSVVVIGTVVDITERKQAEEERRQLEAQIQHAQKLESLGVLAGGIAHDFNNLLTAMLGNASLALLEIADESPAVPMLREIEQAAQRAADLTQQMLAYSGKGTFLIQPLRLDMLVQEISKLLRTVISKKATVELNLAPATIDGDATQVRQVVMNLITNASDALADNVGVIRVRTGVRDGDAASHRSLLFPDEVPRGAYAYIEVEDNGCGMSDETRARMFDPFYTTKFAGRGLGLAAVLGIVRGHRGRITVASTPQKGSTVEVLFPCSTRVPWDEAESDTRAPPRGQGTVLVVDDEPGVRNLARRALQSAGFQVHDAEDGRKGLELFVQHRHETVAMLLDLTMPRMDGMEVLAELRQLAPYVPVVVMSGYSELETSRRFAGMSANGFIQKPFRPHDLIACVCRLLPSRITAG